MKDGIDNIRYLLMDITAPDYQSLVDRFEYLHDKKQKGNPVTKRECINPDHRIVKVCADIGWLETERSLMDTSKLDSSGAILAIYEYKDLVIVNSLKKSGEPPTAEVIKE